MNIYTLLAEGTTAIAEYSVGQFGQDVATIFGSAMDMAREALNFTVSNGLTLTFAAIPLVGIGIGIYRRFVG